MSIDTALPRLRKALSDQFMTSDAVRTLHGQNETYFPEILPDGVAFPESTDDVVKIVKICAEESCPIIPWGTGTSLEGNALAIQGGITLDMSKMDKVLDVHPQDLDAVVQPGMTREALNTHLRDTGLFFPVDPGANASLGGMASTRASGTTAVRYGTMRENVMALEVVLADGRVMRTGSRARKSASGYDLTKLIVGSEGTLGIITELTLRLQGQPEAISAAVCRFDGIDGAVNTVIETIQMGVPIARMEFLDKYMVKGFNIHFKTDMPETPHLFLEFHGSDAGVREQAETVGEIAASHGGQGFEWSTRPEDRKRLWDMRHNAYYAQKALRPGCQAISTDVCVPISRLAEAVRETEADLAASPLVYSLVGHVGDGNFHSAILVEAGNEAELQIAKDLTAKMYERSLALGGTVTGEHGVGMGKTRFMQAEHGAGWQVMGQIKQTLDPQNILNPGKVVQVN